MGRGRKPASPKVQDLAEGRLRVITGGGKPPGPPKAEAPPAWITDANAKKLWRQLVGELRRRKQYIGLFEVELGRYCVAFGQYVAALKKMNKPGPVVLSSKGTPMLSQYWVVANRAHETMLRLAGDLGLNPVAQNRMAGLQLDMFDDPPATGTDGGPDGGTGFGRLRAP